jgi:hypothetical protein
MAPITHRANRLMAVATTAFVIRYGTTARVLKP